MGWRLARSLVVLRDQVNALWPQRSKRSDGTVGDLAHQGRVSDHNPNGAGVVCAMDITHDPAHGADMHDLAALLVKFDHPAIKYVIWNRRIWSKARAGEGWRTYAGSNPHTKHLHISVGGHYDATVPWNLNGTLTPPSNGDDDMANDLTAKDRQWIERLFSTWKDDYAEELLNSRVITPPNGDPTAQKWTVGHILDWQGRMIYALSHAVAGLSPGTRDALAAAMASAGVRVPETDAGPSAADSGPHKV